MFGRLNDGTMVESYIYCLSDLAICLPFDFRNIGAKSISRFVQAIVRTFLLVAIFE